MSPSPPYYVTLSSLLCHPLFLTLSLFLPYFVTLSSLLCHPLFPTLSPSPPYFVTLSFSPSSNLGYLASRRQSRESEVETNHAPTGKERSRRQSNYLEIPSGRQHELNYCFISFWLLLIHSVNGKLQLEIKFGSDWCQFYLLNSFLITFHRLNHF